MDQWYQSGLLLVILNACPQRGQGTKNWVSSLFLLRKKALTHPSDLSWWEKIKTTGNEIPSKCFSRERDQAVPKFTNILHTLHTNLVLKYCGGLHRYIQAEMEFLDISSLGAAYRYAVKNRAEDQTKDAAIWA
jgi:hypothetical protein